MIRSGSGRERRTNAVIATLTILAIPVALIVAGWGLVVTVFGADEAPDCDSYSFNQDAWDTKDGDDREEEAAALAHCDAINGMPRTDVRALLGDPNPRRRPAPDRWTYSAGWVNDAIGIGDGQTLIVRFDENDRVTSADVTYPPTYD